MGIVGIDVHVPRILDHNVVGVAPGRDVPLPLNGVQIRYGFTLRDADRDDPFIALADRQHALVRGTAEQNVLGGLRGAGVRAVPVTGQPDRIRPPVAGPGIHDGLSEPEIGDRVSYLDPQAGGSLIRGEHIAGDQVGRRQRHDLQGDQVSVILFVRIFVHLAPRIRHNHQIHWPAHPLRDHNAVGLGEIAFQRAQRRSIVEFAEQRVIRAVLVIRGQIDSILPVRSLRGRWALVRNHEFERYRASGRDTRRRGHRLDLKVRMGRKIDP